MTRKFYTPKSYSNHADPLAAVGLAHLLCPTGKIVIRDDASSGGFSVTTDRNLEVGELGQDAGFQFLRPNEKATRPNELTDAEIFDYPAMKEAEQRSRDAKKQKKSLSLEGQEMAAQDGPPPDFYLYQALNLLQGDGATNKAFLWVRNKKPAEWSAYLEKALAELEAGRVPESDLDLDLVQLFSPHAAKGYARLKPDSTSRGDKTKDSWAEPFLEWLRFRGYFQVACPYGLGPKREHLRLIVPTPKDISFVALRSVAGELRSTVIFGSSPKIDALATLKLAQLLIRQGEQTGERRRPASMISGVHITHYQSLGQAKAVTGMEQLAVPDWFPNDTVEQSRRWNDILDEHFQRLRWLKDENSDELALLIQYRQFLENRGEHGTRRLLDFLEGYGVFVMRQRGQNKWVHKQFQEDHLEAILSETSYRQILDNPGFRAVAGAIRSATMSAQSRKRNKLDHREIRYGLLPELRRKRMLPKSAEFLESVHEFITTFNAESGRRLETGKATGIKRVTTEELASFMDLFEQNTKGASLIGSMLLAYATCREVRDAEEPVTPEDEKQG